AGTLDHMLRRWKVYKAGSPKLSWADWKASYVPNQANDARGDAYHRNVAKRLKLRGADWMCEDNRLWKEEGLSKERRFDSVNRKLKIAYEVKSGNSRITDRQLRLDRELTRKGWKVVYITSRELRQPTLDRMARHGVQHATLRSTAVLTNPSKPTGGQLSPNPQQPTGGAAKDLANRSGKSLSDARARQQVQNDLTNDSRRKDFSPRRPGGIDWTSLELHYVSETPQSGDFQYAFSAGELADDGEAEPSFGGEAALNLSSDALFTWLALDPSQFWVNLNPDTPDTVIDEEFATTDAGRVLLEADLELKRAHTDLMRPESETGAEFWESLERTEDGVPCFDSYRIWIEPHAATVRVDGDQLYILDAPLRVQHERMDIQSPRPGGPGCTAPEAILERNFEVMQEVLEPELEEEVNTAPEFADLRRVYTARVAAQWLRERDARRPGAFHDIIRAGDVSDWPARTEWDPQPIFDEYVEDFQTVQFRYEWENEQGEFWIEVGGGVDFARSPRDPVSTERFEREHPALPRTVRSSAHEAVSTPVAAQPGDAVGTFAEDTQSVAWLGGGPVVQEPDPGPGPSDPPDEPDPTDPPGDGDGPGGNGPGGSDPGDNGGGGGDDDGGGADDGRDDGTSRGDRDPQPPPGAMPDVAPGDVVAESGPMPATGFDQAWLVPVALVLVLGGLALVLLRRRLGGR
ncbi:hypothetical protein, partial [Isoptericola hypogeus]